MINYKNYIDVVNERIINLNNELNVGLVCDW